MPITTNSSSTNSVNNQSGRYVQGGVTDVFRSRLGFWDRFSIPKSSTDFSYVITPHTQYRPDLVAYEMYGKATLQWLVLQYNGIVDLNEEFVAGNIITLPTPARLQSSILTNSSGGKSS